MRQGERTDLGPSATIAKRREARQGFAAHDVDSEGAQARCHPGRCPGRVKRGDVSISDAAAFANKVTPPDQARLIAEHGTPADAVNATVKAKADSRSQPRRRSRCPMRNRQRIAQSWPLSRSRGDNAATLIGALQWFERVRAQNRYQGHHDCRAA